MALSRGYVGAQTVSSTDRWHSQPGTEYLSNWLIDAIAWYLEQVRHGRIKRLITTMPPISAKSISASLTIPAFIHGHDPTKEIITVSYAQQVAAKQIVALDVGSNAVLHWLRLKNELIPVEQPLSNY